jgi:hypothetical protein
MNRLAVTLGIVVAISSLAMGFSEDFESYSAGATLAGSNGWLENGLGNFFQANAAVSGDPSFLGTRYADLSRNTNPATADDAWLWQSFTSVASGTLILEFDTNFQASGDLDACTIFLSGPDRTPGLMPNDLAAGISVDLDGLRVFDGGWRVVTNFNIVNDTWYHSKMTVDMDNQTWQLEMGAYSGDTLDPLTLIAYSSDDTFTFIDNTVTEIGMIEFSTTYDIMSDPAGRGFYVDNVNVPEPATLSLLGIAGFLTLRRRK